MSHKRPLKRSRGSLDEVPGVSSASMDYGPSKRSKLEHHADVEVSSIRRSSRAPKPKHFDDEYVDTVRSNFDEHEARGKKDKFLGEQERRSSSDSSINVLESDASVRRSSRVPKPKLLDEDYIDSPKIKTDPKGNERESVKEVYQGVDFAGVKLQKAQNTKEDKKERRKTKSYPEEKSETFTGKNTHRDQKVKMSASKKDIKLNFSIDSLLHDSASARSDDNPASRGGDVPGRSPTVRQSSRTPVPKKTFSLIEESSFLDKQDEEFMSEEHIEVDVEGIASPKSSHKPNKKRKLSLSGPPIDPSMSGSSTDIDFPTPTSLELGKKKGKSKPPTEDKTKKKSRKVKSESGMLEGSEMLPENAPDIPVLETSFEERRKSGKDKSKKNTTRTSSVAMASEKKHSRTSAVAMGTEKNSRTSAVAMGTEKQSRTSAVAMGTEKKQSRTSAVAMGTEKKQSRTSAVAMGTEKKHSRTSAVAMGTEKKQSRISAIAMATEKKQSRTSAIAMGTEKKQSRTSAVAMGTEKKQSDSKEDNINILEDKTQAKKKSKKKVPQQGELHDSADVNIIQSPPALDIEHSKHLSSDHSKKTHSKHNKTKHDKPHSETKDQDQHIILKLHLPHSEGSGHTHSHKKHKHKHHSSETKAHHLSDSKVHHSAESKSEGSAGDAKPKKRKLSLENTTSAVSEDTHKKKVSIKFKGLSSNKPGVEVEVDRPESQSPIIGVEKIVKEPETKKKKSKKNPVDVDAAPAITPEEQEHLKMVIKKKKKEVKVVESGNENLADKTQIKEPKSKPKETKIVNKGEDTQEKAKAPKKKSKASATPSKGPKDKQKRKVVTGYLLFCKKERSNIAEANPGLEFVDISRKVGEAWNNLSDKEKQKWRDKANTMKAKLGLLVDKKDDKKPESAKSGPDVVDMAAHLKLLGESLSVIGASLMAQRETEVHGSLSVLLDSILCAICPLTFLTSYIPGIPGISKDKQVQILDDLAYTMPGLG